MLINTVMTPSFRTDRSGQKSADPDQTAPRGAVWSGSSLFAIPFASFWLNTCNLRFGHSVWFLGSLQQCFLIENQCCGCLLEMPHVMGSIPIYPLQRVFYPQNLPCTPKIEGILYMLLYIGGTKVWKKSYCTLSFKMQWEPCMGAY